jgi:hypothetical protein
MREVELVSRKMSSIVRSLELALILQKEKPQIVGDYREGRYLSEIVSKYDIDTYQIGEYTVNKRIARQATYIALNGHTGGFGINPFVGLLEEGEREKLAREHRFRNAHEIGEAAYENRTGIHGRTRAQIFKHSRKAGRIAGPKTYLNGIGIHGRSKEKMSIDGRNAARKRWEKYYEEHRTHKKSKA